MRAVDSCDGSGFEAGSTVFAFLLAVGSPFLLHPCAYRKPLKVAPDPVSYP